MNDKHVFEQTADRLKAIASADQQAKRFRREQRRVFREGYAAALQDAITGASYVNPYEGD